MKKHNEKQNRINKTPTIIGYVGFFLLVAAIVTVALLIHSVVAEKSDGNNTVIAITMLCVVLGLTLICLVADYIRRRITVNRPVNEILAATDAIASGDFSVQAEPRHSLSYYDEYDCIMENINKMAAELSKSAMLSSDFISNVSHELKTPLAVIQNYAMLLKKDGLSEEKRKEYAEVLVETSARLTALVMNVLKLNKLENQEIKPEYEKVRLDEMLVQSVLSFEPLIDGKSLELDCDIGEAEVFTSPNYLEIVWNNLISNAVKFTPNGGKIGISLKVAGDKAVVRISDTGCGISSEVGERIFDKFYQGDTSHAKEGNGLGLALVKKVIDVLGGEITVESEVGVGTAFTVTLRTGGRN